MVQKKKNKQTDINVNKPHFGEVYLLLDNIRSILNVGAIFRTADAAGVKKIYLCGITAYPSQKDIRTVDQKEISEPATIHKDGTFEINYIPSKECFKLSLKKRIAKTALKALGKVEWEYRPKINDLIDELRTKNIQTIALEQSKKSIDYRKAKPNKSFALVVGNEVEGTKEETLDKCDLVIELPMRGEGKSLNVATATGISLYKLTENRE